MDTVDHKKCGSPLQTTQRYGIMGIKIEINYLPFNQGAGNITTGDIATVANTQRSNKEALTLWQRFKDAAVGKIGEGIGNFVIRVVGSVFF